MKKILLLAALLLFSPTVFSQDTEPEEVAEPETELPSTAYYLIRHSEKELSDPTDDDPHLTQQGLLRSAKLSYVLENVKFDAVYSTNYNRTTETAQPIAEKNGIDALTFYDPRSMDMKGFVEETNGKTVLIVGHSNTTPFLVNTLIGEEKYEEIDESVYSHLY
ncbi:MAG: histidine phosphatase family protein, partial [Bacteroidia bacterium]|nr:histidine phosphatase family protein [Bacteroidia bacterium]